MLPLKGLRGSYSVQYTLQVGPPLLVQEGRVVFQQTMFHFRFPLGLAIWKSVHGQKINSPAAGLVPQPILVRGPSM